MRIQSVMILARADLSLHRRAVVVYAAAAALGATLAWMPQPLARSCGMSLVLCVLIGLCFHLPIVSVLQDIARGTRAFVLALPVTPSEWAAGKLLAGSLLFLLPAGAAVAAALAVPADQRLFPAPMILLGLLGGLIFFLQNLGLALISESMGVSMSLLMGQIFVLGNVVPHLGARLPAVFHFWAEMHTGGPLRTAAACLLALELAVTVAVVLLLMNRKRRFV